MVLMHIPELRGIGSSGSSDDSLPGEGPAGRSDAAERVYGVGPSRARWEVKVNLRAFIIRKGFKAP